MRVGGSVGPQPPASPGVSPAAVPLQDVEGQSPTQGERFCSRLAELTSAARASFETSCPTSPSPRHQGEVPTQWCWLSGAWQPRLCVLANEQRAPLKAWAHFSLSLWRLKMSEEALGPDHSLPLSNSVALGRFLNISEPRRLCLAEIKAATSASRGR